MDPITKELTRYPIQLEIPVQWGDMDAFQHVNNLVYLRWFESARIAYMMALGHDITSGASQSGVILSWQDCKYIYPVTFPDEVLIGIKVSGIELDRFHLQAKIFSKRHNRLVAIANGSMVSYDYQNQQKTQVPKKIQEAILTLEGPASTQLLLE